MDTLFLSKTDLFRGIPPEDIESMLGCLKAATKTYQRGEFICREGETVTVSFAYIPAALTKEAIDATLFQDVLGAVSTNHTNDANRNTNLKLACKAINGKLIRPGETFSYNATLGERTEKKGYKPAGALSAGTSTTEVGGGIRSMETVRTYLEAGVSRVILGTAAVKDPAFLSAALEKHGEKIAVVFL